MKVFLTLFFVVLVGFLGHMPDAASITDLTAGVLYPSTRALAMGGVGVSVYHGAHSVFYNPAGLRKKRDFKLSIFNGYGEGSANQWISNGGDNRGSRDLDERILKLEQLGGGSFYDSFGGFPYIMNRDFLIGASYRDQSEAHAPEGHGEQVEYSSITDLNYLFAYTKGYFENALQIGVLGKVINRSEVVPTLIEDSSAISRDDYSYANDLRTGRAFNLDIGANLVLPIRFLPTFSAVWRNIGQRKFKNRSVPFESRSHPEPPSPFARTMDAGFSLTPRFSRQFRMTLAGEYSDIYSNMSIGDKERLHAGIEFAFYDSFFIRAGYSHGEATYGLGFSFEGFELDLSGYGIRRYYAEYRQEEVERRWVIRLGLSLF